MIFANRKLHRDGLLTLSDAERYDRYLCSRSKYKRDFVASVVRHAGAGPVLDYSSGFGSIGFEVACRSRAPISIAYRHEWAAQIQRRRFADAGLELSYCLEDCGAGAPPLTGGFRLAYSTNHLHTCEEPKQLFKELRRLTAPGGVVLINEVKRDADPFFVEYIIRESEADRSPDGTFSVATFLATLQSSYATNEIITCLAEIGVTKYHLNSQDPITFTLEFDHGE